MYLIELTLDEARELSHCLSRAVADVEDAELSRSMKPRAVLCIPGDATTKLAITGVRREVTP